MAVLQNEAELLEIVRLIGMEALSDQERLLMATAKSLREDFLHQNAFDEADAFTSLRKQFLMLKLIMGLHRACGEALRKGRAIEELLDLPVREEIARAKFIPEDELDRFAELEGEVARQAAAGETEADQAAVGSDS